ERCPALLGGRSVQGEGQRGARGRVRAHWQQEREVGRVRGGVGPVHVEEPVGRLAHPAPVEAGFGELHRVSRSVVGLEEGQGLGGERKVGGKAVGIVARYRGGGARHRGAVGEG